MIDVKQPHQAVDIIRRAEGLGASLEFRMAGDGPERARVEHDIRASGLGDRVVITGLLPAQSVAGEMRSADVFLFTSNRRDGWGMVLNEAMGYGCCAVSSNAAGAPPWLIEHGSNGLLYDGGEPARAAEHVARLARDRDDCRRMGQRGAETLRTLWSADNAAERLIRLAQGLEAGRDMRGCFDRGPCSAAP